jgi:hypothetical protein
MAKGRKRKTPPKIAFRDLTTKSSLPGFQELKDSIPYYSQKPVFGFRYCDNRDREFAPKRISQIKDFYKLFERLTTISNLTWREIETSDIYHAHDIEDWNATSRPSGFSCYPAIKDFPGYQFEAFGEFRIIGFFNRAIFHVVWLDRNHKLYPRK